MAKSKLSGKVQTVLGPVDPASLGITHTHEHLLIDTGCYFQMPEEASEREWIGKPFTADRRGGVFKRWNYACENGQLLDVQLAVQEALRFKHAGGGTLVDVTSIGIARDPLALTRISRATGLNVVMGASHYTPPSYPSDMDKRTEESIADRIIRDITVGVGDTGVRSGIIGEVGHLWPPIENERKVERASAYAALETGATVLIHPGFHPDSPPAIIEALVEAGLPADRIVMGHLDVFQDKKWFKDLAESGCYMEWDVFGFEESSLGAMADDPGLRFTIANDVQRMEIIEYLVGLGYGDRIVIGHDVCMKVQQVRYGGKGYAHIVENIVPRMRKRGFTEAQVRTILVDNPRSVLTFR